MLNLPLLLASASPRRHELLNQAGIPHTVVHIPAPPGEDEPQLDGESAIAYVQRTADDKLIQADDYLRSQQADAEHAILCADTTVELHGTILAKPIDATDAKHMLQSLSGQRHHVHTAVALLLNGKVYRALSTSTVHMKALSEAEIIQYCASKEPMGKAGAYGIQGRAGVFVQHLEGSYSGVMGLPLYETYQLLQEAGLLSYRA